MLTVDISDFRCWPKLKIQIPIGSITLLKGCSGTGKTTILRSIAWCFYGNMRNITPKNNPDAKTKVSISFPINHELMAITRSRNPRRLLVEYKNHCSEDDVAQAIINDLFGNYDIWLASCCINQKRRNTFLAAPNTAKMELLHSIAFHEENPADFISKIDDKYKLLELQYNTLLAEFNADIALHTPMLQSINYDLALNSSQVATMTQELVVFNTHLDELVLQRSTRKAQLQLLADLQKKLQTLPITPILPAVPISLSSKFPNMTPAAMLQYGNTYLPLIQQRESMVTKLTTLKSKLKSNHLTDDYSTEEMSLALANDNLYQEELNYCRELDISYDLTAVNSLIESYRNLLAAQDHLQLQQQITTLNSELQQLKQGLTIPNVTIPTIIAIDIMTPTLSLDQQEVLRQQINTLTAEKSSLSTHLSHLKLGSDVVQCPNCNYNLRHVNRTLVKADVAPSNNDEIAEINSQLQKIETDIAVKTRQLNLLIKDDETKRRAYDVAIKAEQQRLSKLNAEKSAAELKLQRLQLQYKQQEQKIIEVEASIIQLQDKVKDMDDNTYQMLLSKQEIETVYGTISRLQELKYLSLSPVSNEVMASTNANNKLLREIAILEKQLSELDIPEVFSNDNVRSLTVINSNIVAYLNSVEKIQNEIHRLTQNRKILEEQIVKAKVVVDDPSEEIIVLEQKIKDYKSQLEYNDKIVKAYSIHEMLSTKRQKLVDVNSEMTDMGYLRQHAKNLESQQLQSTVDCINQSVQSVCESLYDSPLNISLQLFKTIKSTKDVKPIVNFTITNKGATYDNVDDISGGEGDRASLAITLALKRLSSCPLIMLDECVVSVDTNIIETTIKTIRHNTNDTVLLTFPDFIEGLFDHVINVEDFV